MKYFLHDTNSFNDEKVTELYVNFGYEGLGLFYTILEKLALQEKPVKTHVLKHQLGVGRRLEKCWSFMEEIDIISSSNGETFNKQLLKFSEKYQIKKEKNAKRISEWRDSQAVTENVTHYESVRNTPKVKKSKVKENNTDDFEIFWNTYDKKIDSSKCKEKWNKLDISDRLTILATVERYVKAHPEIKFRKNPLTYLNGQCWKDDIIDTMVNTPTETPQVRVTQTIQIPDNY